MKRPPTWDINNYAPLRQNASRCYGLDGMTGQEILAIFAKCSPNGAERLGHAG